jgi:hypothetical protein
MVFFVEEDADGLIARDGDSAPFRAGGEFARNEVAFDEELFLQLVEI